ncbi:MAG TPA: fumarylacetoacetate hydrolase family protein [Steroidobacteraceae bacterium]
MNDPTRAQRAAHWLLQVRRAGGGADAMPAAIAPRSEQEAYEVQQAVIEALDTRVRGWKVAMNDAQQGQSAPILAAELHVSPARVRCGADAQLGIEPEVAFSLARELPPLAAGAHYGREQILEAVDAAYAAIEIVVSRFRSHEAPPLERLADNLSNGGLVLSAPHRDWRRLEFGALPLRLTLQAAGGASVEHASRGGHPLGDPLLALVWLVNDRARRGRAVRAGEPITTGSYAGLRQVQRGAQVRVEFAGLGTAMLQVD